MIGWPTLLLLQTDTMVTATATRRRRYHHYRLQHITAQLPCCDHVPLIVYLLRRQQVAVVVYTNYYYYYALVLGVFSRSTAAATATVVRAYLSRGVQ